MSFVTYHLRNRFQNLSDLEKTLSDEYILEVPVSKSVYIRWLILALQLPPHITLVLTPFNECQDVLDTIEITKSLGLDVKIINQDKLTQCVVNIPQQEDVNLKRNLVHEYYFHLREGAAPFRFLSIWCALNIRVKCLFYPDPSLRIRPYMYLDRIFYELRYSKESGYQNKFTKLVSWGRKDQKLDPFPSLSSVEEIPITSKIFQIMDFICDNHHELIKESSQFLSGLLLSLPWCRYFEDCSFQNKTRQMFLLIESTIQQQVGSSYSFILTTLKIIKEYIHFIQLSEKEKKISNDLKINVTLLPDISTLLYVLILRWGFYFLYAFSKKMDSQKFAETSLFFLYLSERSCEEFLKWDYGNKLESLPDGYALEFLKDWGLYWKKIDEKGLKFFITHPNLNLRQKSNHLYTFFASKALDSTPSVWLLALVLKKNIIFKNVQNLNLKESPRLSYLITLCDKWNLKYDLKYDQNHVIDFEIKFFDQSKIIDDLFRDTQIAHFDFSDVPKDHRLVMIAVIFCLLNHQGGKVAHGVSLEKSMPKEFLYLFLQPYCSKDVDLDFFLKNV